MISTFFGAFIFVTVGFGSNDNNLKGDFEGMGKFKVWDSKIKMFLCDDWLFFINQSGELWFMIHSEKGLSLQKAGENFITVFSTGKTDKNGVEWHDGEILTYIKEKRPALHGSIKVVVFHDNTFRLQCELCRTESRLFKPEPLFSVYNMYGHDFLNDLYSIGNKFENPELMESP